MQLYTETLADGNCMCIIPHDSLSAGYVPLLGLGHLELLGGRFGELSLGEKGLLPNVVVVDKSAREIVLRRCGQVEPLSFRKCYPDSSLRNCQKIGEGVYGEVFLFKNPLGGTTVIKVVPIEGDQRVNGERQKKFGEILSEIIIATELSNLRHKSLNSTSTFNEVQNIRCVQGQYPQRLLDLWDLYDEIKGSKNDCPEMFDDSQLYIILELKYGGNHLDEFVFDTAEQAFYMFQQVAFALAVAEKQVKFEHRDLHWGNVVLSMVENESVTYQLNGQSYDIPTKGLKATIIDFTLSRIECDGVIIYNDLSEDEGLFSGGGDYQFDIYRMMQQRNGNNWQKFEPFSNLLWLDYLLDIAVSALTYKTKKSKVHKRYITKMRELRKKILDYNSVYEFVSCTFI